MAQGEDSPKAQLEPDLSKHDWRNQVVTTLAEAVTLRHRHEKGTLVKGMVRVNFNPSKTLGFALPNNAALMVSLALRMYTESNDLLSIYADQREFDGVIITNQDAQIFDLLEKRMASVIFAFTALEAFANDELHSAYEQIGYRLRRPDKFGEERELSLEEAERSISLDEKLHVVLPQIFETKTIKGTALWQRYAELREIRNRIIHNKRGDRIIEPGKQTLWELLTREKFRNYALDTKSICDYYVTKWAERRPRWLHMFPSS